MIAAQITPGVKVYEGRHDSDGNALVMVNGRQLTPERSLAVRDHSPTGFSWGYAGSGPAQLALALLLDHFEDVDIARRLYQPFKFRVVASWPAEREWKITGSDIDAICAELG